MERVFISHPYSDKPRLRLKQVESICRSLENDILPISPLHLFSFEDNDKRRKEILQVCFNLIDMCDEVWFYMYGDGCPYQRLSEGQQVEFDYVSNKKFYGGQAPECIAYKEPPQECIEIRRDNMLCDKCNNNLCKIRTKLDIFHDEIDGMSRRDKEYYCEEMISRLEDYGVAASEVNFCVQIDECYRSDKRIFKEG